MSHTPVAVTSIRGQRMLDYLPEYYHDSTVIRSIAQATGTEIDLVRTTLYEIREQWFARTATWALDTWEGELGLPTIPLADEPRRERIVGRLRSAHTATPAVVKVVAEAWANGEIDVIEDFGAYRVIIRFVSQTGIPATLSVVQLALRDLIPAHLAIEYEFNYLLWDELDVLKDLDERDEPPLEAYTWDELEALTADGTLTWDELEEYK